MIEDLSRKFSHVCMLCGARAPSEELLNEHLGQVHQTSVDELRHINPSTSGPQGPQRRAD